MEYLRIRVAIRYYRIKTWAYRRLHLKKQASIAHWKLGEYLMRAMAWRIKKELAKPSKPRPVVEVDLTPSQTLEWGDILCKNLDDVKKFDVYTASGVYKCTIER